MPIEFSTPGAHGEALPQATEAAAACLPPPATADKHLLFWNRRLKGDERSYVYVIKAYDGAIKIGIAVNPRSRLATLQTAQARPLELLYVIPGSHKMEQALHQRLKESRLLGEWFAGPAIADFLRWMHDYCEWGIENLRANAELPPLPPLPARDRKPTGGLVSQGGSNSKMGHRWRTKAPEEAPVIVRRVEPAPVKPIEEARAERERYRQMRQRAA